MPYIGNDIQYGELTSQTFTGDGSTVAFTMGYTVANPTSILVTSGNVVQEPTVAYTVAGTTLTFTSAPENADTIHVRYLGRTLDVAQTAIVQDADQDTKIQVEESADEDTIRFDVAGTEVATLTNSALTLIGTELIVPLTNSITAGSTQTQAGATVLTTGIARVTVSGTNGDGVKLPTAVAGQKVLIINDDAAQTIQVWPNTSDAIDGGSANAVDANVLGPGSSREYVASDATNWYTASPLASGNLVSVQAFTSSGTWTKPAGVTRVQVEVRGGGGGGGGASNAASIKGAGGGGQGGRAVELIDVTGTASETVTIGVAGTAGAATGATGGTGGTTSLGSLISATGGVGGEGAVDQETRGGGAGGAGSGGDLNFTGQAGGTGGGDGSILGNLGGTGGGEGGGIGGKRGDVAGTAGTLGGGGGGATCSSGGTAKAGGAGGAGYVIVWEYS
jgi:hypothetical protein